METGTSKPTAAAILLRLAFWASWAGSLALPLLVIYTWNMPRVVYQYPQNENLFFTLNFTAVIGLIFTSALSIKRFPFLARLGMMTLVIVAVFVCLTLWAADHMMEI